MSEPTRIDELERRIERIEAELWRKTFPKTLPPQPPFVPAHPINFDEDKRCPVCWGKYADMTGYVCNNPECPSRVHVTCKTP